ncbi:MAG: exo-alpha-sialidase, partial [Prevotella sp.]|nr:exo-alpha-sialidase [Prevotella sp.]
MKHILTILLSLVFAIPCISQQVYYSGKTFSDPYRHDGGLSPVIGVHNIQIMRADREHPDSSRNIMPWTYNHQPMMAYWKGRFWVHYLSDPQSEHVPPSQTFFQTSIDGYQWSSPATLFPDYGNDMMAVMHQRVGWYVSSKKTGEKLLAIGSYGLCPTPKSDPNDGNGIGRVVREVKEDGTLGPIYFLYLNKNPSPALSKGEGEQITEKKIIWPLYTKSKDRRFREACDEIMSSPLYWMQFVEECDRNDPRLPLKNVYKAFSYYRLPDDNTIVGLWKHALTSQSHDGGKTWTEPVARARGFVNSNAKIWGQRLSDGTYATVYNPAEYRWPLAVSTSVDGIEYTTLSLVQGEISPMRYGGNYKSYGPQYVRGILPGNGTPPDGNMWVSYSMNKEDMWVAKIPVPLRTEELLEANDNFSNAKTLDLWNINSLILAPVGIENGWLSLADEDPYDYARAERVIPATRRLSVSFDVKAMQNDHGMLQMDFLDEKGSPCSRLQWQPDGNLMVKVGARYNNVLKGYEAGRAYHLQVDVDLDARNVTIWVDGKKVGPRMLFAPVGKITRIAFRTGEQRFSPTPDTPADRLPGDDLNLSNLS